MSRLIVVSSGTERTLELESGKTVTVGREPSNDIALPEERQASRRHCEIRQTANGWEVVDLGATNKTRVNGAPADRRALSSGDVVEVGKVTIRYEDAQEDERLQQAGRQGVCLLEWADGPQKGQKVMLVGPRTTLGRRESNTIVLDDRMASGHHAEVVKDLNGYTIRDLGSTNGIMVNGNPTTESPLSHGARLRVGNSRFTFKDPSMKDIEVELSRLEDDDGWGMMGDIDLSRARGSKAGALAFLVVLALVGAGGWYIWNEGQKAGHGGGGGEVGEQIANGNFESEDMPWSWSEGGAVAVARVKSGGGHALQATVDASAKEPELIGYEEEFSASDGRTLKVQAKLKGAGDLVAVWRNEPDRAAGTTGIVRTVTVVSGKGGPSSRTLGFPTWATALRLVLRVQPGERVTLDDLSVRALPNAPSTGLCDCPGLPKGYVEADGTLSIVINNTVLVLGGQPVAWKGKERLTFRSDVPSTQIDLGARVEGTFVGADGEMPATVQWTSTEEGLSGKFECPGADRVGLALDLPRAHLGSVLNVLTAQSARSVALTAGPVASDVRKTLAGNPESQAGRPATLIAVAPVGGTAALAVEDTDDQGLVRLLHELPGAKVEFAILTDFEQQKKAAKEALAAAKVLARTEPGPAHRRLLQVAQEYPFEASVVTESLQLAATLESTAKKDVDGLRESVQAFTILGSTAALDDMLKRAKALREAFLAGGEPPPEGAIETDVPGLVKRAEALAGGHAVERALPDLDRFENVGRMLEETPGFEAMAALVYRSITQNYASLAKADPEVAARLEALAVRRQALEQRPDVRDSLPPSTPR